MRLLAVTPCFDSYSLSSPLSSRKELTDSEDDIIEEPYRLTNYTNLWKTCMLRDIPRVKQLVEECGRDINRVNHVRDIHVPFQLGKSDRNCSTRSSKGLALIHWLALKGYSDITEVLYKSGLLEVNKKGRKNDTALHCAARHGQSEIVKQLLQYGACVDRLNKKGNSPLHIAAMYGFEECVALLIKADADVNTGNLSGDMALHWAARRGDIKIFEHIVSVKDVEVDSPNSAGETPFHLTVKRNCLEAAGILLAKGANANVVDNQGNLALHLAMETDDMNLVQLMYDQPNVDVNKPNQNGDYGLHLALNNCNYDMTKWLLEKSRTNVNVINAEMDTPLHLAVKKDHFEIIRKLVVDCKADMGKKDEEGRLPIHLALKNCSSDVVQLFIEQMDVDCVSERGQEESARAPLQTDLWRMFLEHYVIEKGVKTTPLRIVIKRMPDVAELIFDRCIGHDKLSSLFMNHEFLDDTYSKWELEPYNKNFNVLKFNHPMKMLETYNRKDLLDHPLLRMLIKKKWQAASVIYFSFLVFYVLFVSFFSAFMISSVPPYVANLTNLSSCNTTIQSHFEIGSTYIIYLLAGMGMSGEIVQLVLTKRKYLEVHNILDWLSYITAIIVPINLNSCGVRTDWQWQLGCFTILVSWMNFLFFLRRLPRLGLYVVMITMILKTFFQFFTIFFLFVVAFAITLYLLLQNQFVFSSPSHSIVKSWVMMFGEFDYTGIFHSFRKSDGQESQVPYEGFTFAIFITFLIMITLIVMNLLVALAVSDVEKLQKNSVYEMLGMQIDLALDVELSLPRWLHKRISGFQHDSFGDLEASKNSWCQQRWIKGVKFFFQGPLYAPWIIRNAKEIVRRRHRPHMLKRHWTAATKKDKKDKKVQGQLDIMGSQMNEMQQLLKKIVGKTPGKMLDLDEN